MKLEDPVAEARSLAKNVASQPFDAQNLEVPAYLRKQQNNNGNY